MNTLFAAIGTAQYPLSINGDNFTQADNAPGGTGSPHATLAFNIGTAGWTVVGTAQHGGSTTYATGSTPSNAATVKITPTWQNATGDTDAGTVTNGAASYTGIPSGSTVGCTILETHGSTGTSGQTTYTVLIQMKDSGGHIISTTTCTFVCVTSTG